VAAAAMAEITTLHVAVTVHILVVGHELMAADMETFQWQEQVL
jgi:hypothetical protein